MVATDDDELAAEVRLLRSHGMTTLSWDRHRGRATGHDVVALGFNYRMDEPTGGARDPAARATGCAECSAGAAGRTVPRAAARFRDVRDGAGRRS